jgi:transcriptional antiterminator NusG
MAGDKRGERVARTRQSFNMGVQVKIFEGPFESFTGSIEEVNTKEHAQVMVNFCRATHGRG